MTMELRVSQVSFDEKDKGSANSFSEVSSHFEQMDPHDRRYFEVYTRALLHIKKGNPTKAKELFGHLNGFSGYQDFERRNSENLRIVKLLVDPYVSKI